MRDSHILKSRNVLNHWERFKIILNVLSMTMVEFNAGLIYNYISANVGPKIYKEEPIQTLSFSS